MQYATSARGLVAEIAENIAAKGNKSMNGTKTVIYLTTFPSNCSILETLWKTAVKREDKPLICFSFAGRST